MRYFRRRQMDALRQQSNMIAIPIPPAMLRKIKEAENMIMQEAVMIAESEQSEVSRRSSKEIKLCRSISQSDRMSPKANIKSPSEVNSQSKNNDINDLAEKILLLIKNEKLRMDMGKYAFENSKRFSEDIIMNRWIALFTNLENNKIIKHA